MRRWCLKGWRIYAAAAMLAAGAGFLLLEPEPSDRISWKENSRAWKPELHSDAAFAEPRAYACPVPGDFQSVDIPVGLLSDYYEHGIEHAPPRDPSGVMQRRERYYAAPPDPLVLIELKATASQADRKLAAGVKLYLSDSRHDDENGIGDLGEAASGSSLSARELLEIGRAFQWLDGDETAAVFYRVGIGKVAGQSAEAANGLEVRSLLHAMDQTKALWRLLDYKTLEARFRLVQRLYPEMSVESRRAAFLVADMLFSQRRFPEAAEQILAVNNEDRRAGDLGALDKSDLHEMDWTTGVMLSDAGRVEEAIPFLRDAGKTVTAEHARSALRLLYICLLESGRINEAEGVGREYVRDYNPASSTRAKMAEEMSEARLRAN